MSILSVLFFGVWIFIQIPFISAQAQDEESPLQLETVQEEPSSRDALREAERALTFADDAPAAEMIQGPSTWIVVRMILTLAICALAVYGVVFFIRKSGKKNFKDDPFLKILATAHLGQNRYAHIVSVGSKAWLLGSSDGGVNLIGEIDEKEVLDEMLLEDSRKAAQGFSGRFPDFGSLLRKFGINSDTNSNITDAEEIRRRRERLKGL